MELKYCQWIRQIKISLINDFRGYKIWEASATIQSTVSCVSVSWYKRWSLKYIQNKFIPLKSIWNMLIIKWVWCCRIRPQAQSWTTWGMEGASFSEPITSYCRGLVANSTAVKNSNLVYLLSKKRRYIESPYLVKSLKAYGGGGVIAPLFLSALDRGEWSTSCPRHFIPG